MKEGIKVVEKTLRQWRREQELSQAQLAEMSGVTTRTIAYWESNNENFRRASFQNVQMAARALGIEVANFYLHDTSKILNISEPKADITPRKEARR